jgi:hypothetical protein
MGMNNVSLDISWGYYNDIDGLDINASNDWYEKISAKLYFYYSYFFS